MFIKFFFKIQNSNMCLLSKNSSDKSPPQTKQVNLLQSTLTGRTSQLETKLILSFIMRPLLVRPMITKSVANKQLSMYRICAKQISRLETTKQTIQQPQEKSKIISTLNNKKILQCTNKNSNRLSELVKPALLNFSMEQTKLTTKLQ